MFAGLPRVFRYCAFSKLPYAVDTLGVPSATGVDDTATGSWRNPWKQSGGRGTFRLHVACKEMDAPSVRCREEEDYQKMLASLLAKVSRRSDVRSVVDADLLALPENCGSLNFVYSRPVGDAGSISRHVFGSAERCSLGGKTLTVLACAPPRGLLGIVSFRIGAGSMTYRFCCFGRRLWFLHTCN